MKWVFLIIIAVVGFMIYKGDMGGARDATKNYNEVMNKGRTDGVESSKPAVMHEYIKNKQPGSIK